MRCIDIVAGGDSVEGEILKEIKNEIGTIRIFKSDRKTTQEEIDNFYKALADLYIDIETA